MGGEFERIFLKALAWTLAFELPVVFTFLRHGPWKVDISWQRAVAAGCVPTLLTLPYLWFIGTWIVPDRMARMVGGELAVAGVETIVIALVAPVDWKRALAISFLANAVSFTAGEFLPLL